MLRHLFRLIWNRKRSNVLLLSEVFLSFVVLFGVGTLLVNFGRNYVLPRGFVYEHVWRLNIAAGQGQKMPRPLLDDVLRQVRALPGVQSVSLTSANTPFRSITMSTNFQRGNRKSPSTENYDADDRYAETMGLILREGRWFQAEDDAAPERPVVISERTRDQLFGPNETVLGQKIHPDISLGITPSPLHQVVGVVADVRTKGDFAYPEPTVWLRLAPHDTSSWESAAVLVRVAPGEGAALQQRIVRTVAGLTRQWTTQVRPLDDDRRDKLRITLVPLVGLSLVGLFLVVNVALGLFGVLWYNINQRRDEIGLRRALGATGAAISRQFLGEMLLLTALGVLAGVLLAAQFPLLGAFDVAPRVYLLAMLLAAGVVFLLTAVCAWHPSRLAAAVQPAVALREE